MVTPRIPVSCTLALLMVVSTLGGVSLAIPAGANGGMAPATPADNGFSGGLTGLGLSASRSTAKGLELADHALAAVASSYADRPAGFAASRLEGDPRPISGGGSVPLYIRHCAFLC